MICEDGYQTIFFTLCLCQCSLNLSLVGHGSLSGNLCTSMLHEKQPCLQKWEHCVGLKSSLENFWVLFCYPAWVCVLVGGSQTPPPRELGNTQVHAEVRQWKQHNPQDHTAAAEKGGLSILSKGSAFMGTGLSASPRGQHCLQVS